MGFSIAEITAVRALPAVLAVDHQGRRHGDAGFAEVVFTSTATGKFHQAYVDGRPAGATLRPEGRALVVPVAEAAGSTVEVIAVDPEDRLTDFGGSLSGYGEADGSRVRLTWSGGRYLGDDLDHFTIYGGPAGAIDRTEPIHAEPIPPTLDGQNFGGFGRGGFGRGGWGRSAMRFTYTTAKLAPGEWAFEIVAADASGNCIAEPPQVSATVEGLLHPPTDPAVADYEEASRTVTLEWTPSSDFAQS